jgi:hypothetical protein
MGVLDPSKILSEKDRWNVYIASLRLLKFNSFLRGGVGVVGGCRRELGV